MNPETFRQWRKKRTEAHRVLITQLKDNPCTDCGVRYPPYVMDFDHRDPSQKKFGLSIGGNNYSRSEKAILAEVAKCDLVCSNCHRERTHGNKFPV